MTRRTLRQEESPCGCYRNAPLPIGSEQTILQPLIVAHMAESLELSPHERVLEIGTGSRPFDAADGEIVAAVTWGGGGLSRIEKLRQ
jgi:protein-L-isoaspartate O-methyltransferase